MNFVVAIFFVGHRYIRVGRGIARRVQFRCAALNLQISGFRGRDKSPSSEKCHKAVSVSGNVGVKPTVARVRRCVPVLRQSFPKQKHRRVYINSSL